MKILFEGDSSTDSGRDRSNPHDLGEGYPKFASAMIEDAFQEREFEFFDLGREDLDVHTLAGRIEDDLSLVEPDVVSLLAGQDEILRAWKEGKTIPDGEFAEDCRAVLTAIREQTDAEILLIEPFFVSDDCHEDEEMRKLFEPKQNIIRQLAEEFGGIFLPMQSITNEILKKAGDDADEMSDGNGLPSDDLAVWMGEQILTFLTPVIESRPEKEKDEDESDGE